MAMGKPIVATDVGNTRRTLKNGKLGIIVRPDDPKDLAKGIEKALKNKKLAEKLGKNARKESIKKFL